MPLALYALTAGAFGIGVTEFVIMGLLLEVSADLGVSIAAAGLLISGYALGVVVGAPLLTALTARWPRKTVLLGLMVVFIVGNAACALASTYTMLMAARVLTAFAHGTFFGVGSVVATGLVAPNRRASAIAVMFTGLTIATILGVPFGTWLGQAFGWRSTFWVVTIVGLAAAAVIAIHVPHDERPSDVGNLRKDIRALARRPVLLALLTTVLGYAGVFAVFTYIAPLLTQITGFDETAVSPILLVFGAGLMAGNLIGGRLADRILAPTVFGSLLALAVVLGVMTFALHDRTIAVVFVGLLGAAAFATVPPLQMWVLEKAAGAGQSLASSLNIAAFNLGNALGAWLGGVVIEQGPGLGAVTWVAALAPLAALVIVSGSLRIRIALTPTSMKTCSPGKPARPIAALAIALTLIAAPAARAQAAHTSNWIGTWTASPQPIWDGDNPLPTNVPFNLWNQTIRQVAGVSIGGRRVRVVLSNEYGSRPLVIGAAHVALAGSGSAIVTGSDRTLTFGDRESITIPPGAPAISDPVDLVVAPLSNLAISLFLPETTAPTTFHWDGRQTAYIAAGNRVADPDIDTDTTIKSRLFVSAIFVDAPAASRAVVTLGDSITDGAASTPDTNHRWPDFLARRLAKDHVAILNAGISGARVLKDGMGVNALARFDRDVLSQPGVTTVILLMGINDISWPGTAFAPRDPATSADEIIAGYRQLIARAHAHNVRIVGATLTPFEGALKGTPLENYHTADKERARQAVNKWIRTSGELDAVIDLDAITRDPEHPTRFLPAFDSGDHLHLSDAGNEAVANSIDLGTLFGESP